jgi:TPR repeat protein
VVVRPNVGIPREASRKVTPVVRAAALASPERRLAAAFERSGVAFPPAAVTLIALKREGRLELWARGRPHSDWVFVRSYAVRVTSGRLGPKLREGDHQVPEGIYAVTALNPKSRFHRSLRLNYPNAFDRRHAAADRRTRLGGDIMVHGGAESDGCLPVGDEAAEELFTLAARAGADNVSVIVAPMDFRVVEVGQALDFVGPSRPWVAQLYASLAHELRRFPLPPGREKVAPASKLTVRASACRPYDARDCSKRCEKGDAVSCARAGMMYRDGRRVAVDRERAWSYLGRSCGAGSALGCAELARMLADDDGPRRDVGLAAELARSACDAGDGHGCAYLAEFCIAKLAYGTRAEICSLPAADLLRRRAVASLDSRCTGWAAYDCALLSAMYEAGDQATALRLAQSACRGGDPGGCYQLAQGSKAADAGQLYRIACEAGYTAACDHYASAR